MAGLSANGGRAEVITIRGRIVRSMEWTSRSADKEEEWMVAILKGPNQEGREGWMSGVMSWKDGWVGVEVCWE